MSLLKELINEAEDENKCMLCDRELPNKSIALKMKEGNKKAYFCCNNCKVEFVMKNE
jgi:YHS domain-containing protein